jgi:hypothetical protein
LRDTSLISIISPFPTANFFQNPSIRQTINIICKGRRGKEREGEGRRGKEREGEGRTAYQRAPLSFR